MKLFDSLSGKLVDFEKDKVSIYTCGPTVYSNIHIGNARPLILTDVLRRYLEYKGSDVNFIMNITDIDDKIINKAFEENKTEEQITQTYIDEFLMDLNNLNILTPNQLVSVSKNIEIIKNFVMSLYESNNAYKTEDGIFFDIKKNKTEYGKISKQKIDQLEVSSRKEINTKIKRSPQDFAIWKFTNKGIQWEFDLGKGRPGWHTECCAIIDHFFKDTIDVHIGGVDLKFPHHENERIQFVAKNNKELSNIWLHNGSLNIKNEKMSKSLNNIILVKDFVKSYSANTLKYLMLKNNYSYPLNFSEKDIEDANKWVEKISTLFKKINILLVTEKFVESKKNFENEFQKHMDNNLNTSLVISMVDEIIKQINKDISKNIFVNDYIYLLNIIEILGFSFSTPKLENEDLEKIKLWKAKIKLKDFKEADKIREELINKGIM
ncbi:cysteine--tRNA ligase [Spiroplasma endosymbiont of Crioceris asparagi]|uniref:cysteine--tRNA ligase n=1 Tax=Spiroplasma endosymbiont of Crioceris asparagi TaxID=3066286 RepID=UPI0030D16F80